MIKIPVIVVLVEILALMSMCTLFVWPFNLFRPEVLDETTVFDFVPRQPRSLSDCEELFIGTPASKFNMSIDYWNGLHEFESAVNRSTLGQIIEGYTFQQPTQFKTIHVLAGKAFVHTICETGFNMGHSSFNYLTANPNAVVHSFDMGEHQYAHTMAQYMTTRFPGRFFIHFGDSKQTIPQFIRANPHFRCDMIYVDGGHTYPVAFADLVNLASITNVVERNLIIFDDYPTVKAFNRLFGWAWDDVVRWGYVHEFLRCSFKNKQYQRGFVVGNVIKRPTVTIK
jgi:hypothetical protein